MRKFSSVFGYAIMGALSSVALGFVVLYLPMDTAISLAILIAAVLALIGFGLTVVFYVKSPRQSAGDRTSRSQLDQGNSE